MTLVVKASDPSSVSVTADIIIDGGVVVYPTDTLYGLGASAVSPHSVEKIFDIKGREPNNPIPILTRDREMIENYFELTGTALSLIDRFLPGPLTIVLRPKVDFPTQVSANTGKIGVRISAHPFVQSLFKEIDFPITSTSANPSGQSNIFDFSELKKAFESKVDLIVDSGNIPASKGSTVLDLTQIPPLMLREGEIKRDTLEEIIQW